MSENRKEERNPEKLQVLLSSAADPSSIESALTENVSSRGLRVRTERPWTRDTLVIVLTCESELWARGRVAYCQRLPGDTFAIGLELLLKAGTSVAR
jgi:hypothetical protein